MNTPQNHQYDRLSKAFHWLTALIVLAAFLLGPEDFGHLVDNGVDPATRLDIVWHESLGTVIFIMTFVRLVWVALRPRAPKHALSPVLYALSRLMHLALWALLFALPLAAFMALGSENNPLTLLGGLRMDTLPWIASSSLANLADWGDVHKFLGDSILALAGIHAVSALYHHFKLKDTVLKSMLP